MPRSYVIESLETDDGERKYLDLDERRAFHAATLTADVQTRAFAQVMLIAGPRISEALLLRRCDVLYQRASPALRLRTLKRKNPDAIVYRMVPIPDGLAMSLRDIFDLGHGRRAPTERLWSWSRQTGFAKHHW